MEQSVIDDSINQWHRLPAFEPPGGGILNIHCDKINQYTISYNKLS